MANRTAISAALIAAILGSAGGVAFLHKHPDPTLREVFKACEAGELRGIACCEDMNQVKDLSKATETCGMVTPDNHDPFGVRVKEENDWDQLNAEQKKALQ